MLNGKRLAKDKNHPRSRDHWYLTGKHRGEAHSICNLRFNVPNEIAAVFHNGSNYDYQY